MGDNLHPLDTEVIDQDILEANVATLTTQVNSNTTAIAGINLTNINNQLAGSASSGLLTQIQGNDTDIEGINDKLDATTGSGLKTLIDNKVSMVLGTSAGTALEGNTPTITTAQANKITANENAIDAIELKTDFLDIGNNGLKYSHGNFLTGSSPGDQLLIQHADLNGGSLSNNFCSMRVTANGELRMNVPTGQDYEFRINNVFQYNNTQIKNLIDNISISQNVNLDTIESDVTGIKNNTLASTLKTAVDGNTSSASQNQIVISATATKVANIVGSSTAPAPTDNLVIGSGGATNRYVRIGYANQSNRVGFANEAYFTGGGVYAVEQDLNGDLYLDGYKIEIGSQNLNLTTMNNSIATNASNINQAGINSNNQLATINGIKNNTLASTLKTAVDANSAKTGITAQQASDITANNAKTGITAQQASDITANNAKVGITTQQANDITANNAKTGITAQQASDITANNAKNTFPSGLNSLISRGTNQTLEVGTGSGVPRIRLRGQNGVTNSSELIFIDFINNNPEYYQGATIRFNSSNNRLEFGTDQGNDGSPEGAMFIHRASNPYVEIFRLQVPTTFDLMGIDQFPRQNFMYARRIKLVGSATTPNEWNVPNTQSGIIWNNVIINGTLSYNSTTGILTTSTTGLFKIKAKICLATTSAERVAKIGLKSGSVATGTDVIIGKNHLSRHESHNGSFSAPEIDANVRLASGTNYIFYVECLTDGHGVVKNQQNENNDLCIEQLVLPNGYTLPSNYSPI